jgi:hypothetical protein
MRSMWKILVPAIIVAALAGCAERTETYGYRSGPAYDPAYSYDYGPGYSYHYTYYRDDDWRWRHRHDED